MPVTDNPAVVKVGLGVANITSVVYPNASGTSFAETALDTTTGYITTNFKHSSFAEQEDITANGDIITTIAKNHGELYTFEVIIRSGSGWNATTMFKTPVPNSRIKFDFYAAGTDLVGIVKGNPEVTYTDSAARMTITIQVTKDSTGAVLSYGIGP